MPPVSNAPSSHHPTMEPGVLIFLLYVMIIHELVCGWMEYKRQAAKPKKQARPVWSSRYPTRTPGGSKDFFLRMYVKCGSQAHTRAPIHTNKRDKFRDWKKSGRIVRKA
ncbi:uncharacterized protein LOC144608309 [Rhinoraja longicauda]